MFDVYRDLNDEQAILPSAFVFISILYAILIILLVFNGKSDLQRKRSKMKLHT